MTQRRHTNLDEIVASAILNDIYDLYCSEAQIRQSIDENTFTQTNSIDMYSLVAQLAATQQLHSGGAILVFQVAFRAIREL